MQNVRTESRTTSLGALQSRLRAIDPAGRASAGLARTLVGIPSLDLGPRYLARTDLPAMEARWLYLLLELADPAARVAVALSAPPPAAQVEHLLALLPDPQSARSRLLVVDAGDPSPRALAAKLLDRPDLVGQLRDFVAGRDDAWIVPFAVGADDERLALELGVPVFGVAARHEPLGTKSGSRAVFARAGVAAAAGVGGVRDEAGVAAALERLRAERPEARHAVVKLDRGVTGDGNAIVAIDGRSVLPEHVRRGLARGAVVEELVGGGEPVASPSTQAVVHPDGRVELLATHDQVLDGHTYTACRIPAGAAHADAILPATEKIGAALAARGAVGRFGVDFVVDPADGRALAVEINLREGATTHPAAILRALGGTRRRHAFATDALSRERWRGVSPERFVAAARARGLLFDRATGTGVVLHMLGSLERRGRVGFTAIGGTARHAAALGEEVGALVR